MPPKPRSYPSRKWHGWGDPAVHAELPLNDVAWRFLAEQLGLEEPVGLPVPTLGALSIAETRLEPHALRELRTMLGQDNVAVDAEERLIHGLGKSYRDLIRVRTRKLPPLPDAVLFPASHEEVRRILDWCSVGGVQAVPFGGGSSVVGGVEVRPRYEGDRAVCIDLSRLNRILEVDDVSMLARIQGGIYGPALESGLSRWGLTLGHFPQSFEYSTLGGWIATRSAGQQSTRYGKIEDMVRGLRMAAPAGDFTTPAFPASSAGPDVNRYYIGSEGTFGIITEATMRLCKAPQTQVMRGYMLPDWNASQEALREMLQHGIVPAVLRVSDPPESTAYLHLGATKLTAIGFLLREVVFSGMEMLGAKIQGGCLMLMGFEGDDNETRWDLGRAHAVVRKHGAFPLGSSPGKSWGKERYRMPYLRDLFMDRGVMIDTLETATAWSNVNTLYEAVRAALLDEMAAAGAPGYVMCHISHTYTDGASLYFTFLSPVHGDPEEQWLRVKRAASEAIVRNRGTISHHHSVGYEHRPWMEREYGRNLELYRTTKLELDPNGILNPGKVF